MPHHAYPYLVGAPPFPRAAYAPPRITWWPGTALYAMTSRHPVQTSSPHLFIQYVMSQVCCSIRVSRGLAWPSLELWKPLVSRCTLLTTLWISEQEKLLELLSVLSETPHRIQLQHLLFADANENQVDCDSFRASVSGVSSPHWKAWILGCAGQWTTQNSSEEWRHVATTLTLFKHSIIFVGWLYHVLVLLLYTRY